MRKLYLPTIVRSFVCSSIYLLARWFLCPFLSSSFIHFFVRSKFRLLIRSFLSPFLPSPLPPSLPSIRPFSVASSVPRFFSRSSFSFNPSFLKECLFYGMNNRTNADFNEFLPPIFSLTGDVVLPNTTFHVVYLFCTLYVETPGKLVSSLLTEATLHYVVFFYGLFCTFHILLNRKFGTQNNYLIYSCIMYLKRDYILLWMSHLNTVHNGINTFIYLVKQGEVTKNNKCFNPQFPWRFRRHTLPRTVIQLCDRILGHHTIGAVTSLLLASVSDSRKSIILQEGNYFY